MRPPRFWRSGGIPPWPLPLLARIVTAAAARRVVRPGWTAPVPVICCGNASAGGSGKTPLALDLAARLLARGYRPAFLTRGYGGSLHGPAQIDPGRHDAAESGDEAQLLARIAPTFIGADRAASARLAVANGADVLVMDDGLQNPGLAKTLSLLVIDGGAGFGNGHVMPAGPLREPVASAASRCRAAVLIGDGDGINISLALLPVLRAWIVADPQALANLPVRLLAFAGIGRPEKFFDTLRRSGRAPLDTAAFADHHRYRDIEIVRLRERASALDATLVTTEKDFARLSKPMRAGIATLPIALRWDDPAAIEAILTEALASA